MTLWPTAALLVFPPLALLSMALLYPLVSLPMKRQERARIFLDLLEMCEGRGRDLSRELVSISYTRDADLGFRFHVLAAHLEAGRSLRSAIGLVPRLLPGNVRSMLIAGEDLGDCRQVAGLCRRMLDDAAGTVRMMANHILPLLLVGLPLMLAYSLVLRLCVPTIRTLYEEAEAAPPPFLEAALALAVPILVLACVLYLLIFLIALFHYGGPRLKRWLEFGLAPVLDRFYLWIPWVRTRIHRDFSLALGWLLDRKVPEPKALSLAAGCTANSRFQAQVRRCRQALESGMPLEEALGGLGGRRDQLAWRMRMAAGHSEGFRAALEGWWSWLAARAKRQEQAGAQAVATAMILLNGLLVFLLVGSVFSAISHLVETAALW